MKRKRLLYQELGLELNMGLRRLMPSRVEYGFQNDLLVDFEITNKMGDPKLVTENEFAKWKGHRTIGIFGTRNLVAAFEAANKLYPDAGVVLKKDAKRRRFSR